MSENQQGTKNFEAEQQPVRAFDRRCLLACLAISTFLLAWITFASANFNLRSAVFLFVLPWVLLRTGGTITTALRLPSFFALDFLLGVAVLSVGVMTWKVFVPLSLWIALVILLVAAVITPPFLPNPQRHPLSVLGLLSVLVSLAAATGWSQDLIWPTSSVQ